MKKLNILLVALLITFSAYAQLDRSIRPVAGPAPEIRLDDPASFTLDNGLKVFVVQNTKLPRISVSLVLNNDPIMEGNAVGYVDVAGELIRTGTQSKTKAEIDALIDQIGASLNTSANGIYASSLSKYKSELLEIMSELVLSTDFKQSELDRIIKQTLSGLQTEKDDANAIAANVRSVLVFGKDHPYGQIRTEESVGNITLALCKAYFETYYRPNVAYLAIVGDINIEDAKTLVNKAFGTWGKAEVPKHNYATPILPKGTRVIVVDRPTAVQTVINISQPIILKPGAPDLIAANVMNTILGSGDARLFNNLRETYGFTYGAYSSLSKSPLVGSFNAYSQVRNAVTDSSVTQFLYELNKIRDTIAGEAEVTGILSYLNGTFAIGLQNPQTIASYAIELDRYNLPKDYYRNYLKNLASVTPIDVQNAAKKYVLPSQAYIICVGSKSAIAQGLEKYAADGMVEFFDMYGNKVEAPAKPLPVGLTAEKVISSYVEAIGGAKAWNKVKSLEVTFAATVQGMSLQLVSRKMRPNLVETKVTVNGSMVMSHVVYNGVKGRQSGMQGAKELTGKELTEAKESAEMVPEAMYVTNGYALALKGIETVNDKDTYLIEVVSPSGKMAMEYYAVESGLKIREVAVQDGPNGQITQTSDISDYRSVKGVMLPHKTTLDMGAQLIELEMSVAIVNGKLKASDFKVD